LKNLVCLVNRRTKKQKENGFMKIEENSVLIVIDIQKDFVDGLPSEMHGEKVIEEAKSVISYFRKNDTPIIHFREIHRKQIVDFGRELDGDEGIHTVEGTKGADYYDGLEPLDTEFCIDKRRYSGFMGTDLEILLTGLNVRTIYVIGLLTDVCVHYTCADAHQKDYFVKVFKEAVGGSSLKAHDAALDAIEYLQHGSVISFNSMDK
jgi:nicotinamidase-related amidase